MSRVTEEQAHEIREHLTFLEEFQVLDQADAQSFVGEVQVYLSTLTRALLPEVFEADDGR